MENVIRDTNADFMVHVLELVKENGCYNKAEKIMDYFLKESRHIQELTNYEFDFVTILAFGGCEGIYLDCYIKGNFSEDNEDGMEERLRCGTFKTLDTDLEAMQIFGEFAGSLTYFASKYLRKELHRYAPVREWQEEWWQKCFKQQYEAAATQYKGM